MHVDAAQSEVGSLALQTGEQLTTAGSHVDHPPDLRSLVQ
jgi:hypothetical protein